MNGERESSFLMENILKGDDKVSRKRANRSSETFSKADSTTPSPPLRPRKARTAFTDHQLAHLEASFCKERYLSVAQRVELANRLNLSDTQVKTWYQNRRTKLKRENTLGIELLDDASNMAAVQQAVEKNQQWIERTLMSVPYDFHQGHLRSSQNCLLSSKDQLAMTSHPMTSAYGRYPLADIIHLSAQPMTSRDTHNRMWYQRPALPTMLSQFQQENLELPPSNSIEKPY